MYIHVYVACVLRLPISLVARFSLCANEKMQDESKIYHMSNVTDREKLITSGRINELTHTLLTHSVVKALMAYRTGLDGTMQHYLAVRQAKSFC